MVIRFSHPQYLLLLPLLIAYTWWVMRSSLADLGQARGRLAVGARVLLLTLLIVALAGIQWVRPTHSLCTIFVVDVSDSIEKSPKLWDELYRYMNDGTKGMRQGDKVALVAFGADALLDHAPEDLRKTISHIVSTPSPARTDVAAGIQLAMASFPQEAGKQILLFSDGNENLGDALEQAGLANSSQVRISVYPLARDTSRGEALLRRVTVPANVKQGAPFQVLAVAESTKPADAVVTLMRDREEVDAVKVHLTPGTTVVPFEQTAPKGGMYQYKAILSVPTASDTIPDNNTAFAFAHVAGLPKVLLVEGTPSDGAALTKTLRDYQVPVIVAGPDQIPATLAECAQYDSMIFVNVPAWRMSYTQMAIIRAAVRDTGMGLAMIGGDESFGAGGYYNTPIEDALPITMEAKSKQQYSSVAVALVIEDLEMQDIVNISIEAAKAFVDMLGPIDQLGVIDSYSQWRIPMQKVTNRSALKAKMDGLTNMGDPPSYAQSIDAAAKGLQQCDARVKHIVLIGDGDATFESNTNETENLALSLRNKGITLSTISTGIDGPEAFKYMQKLAKYGGGQAYEAKEPRDLPRYLARDQQTLSRPPIVEEPFKPRLTGIPHTIVQSADWSTAPPLRGYVVTGKRDAPTAQLLMTTHKDDPLLAAWPFGLGRSVAFTSDASGHWGANWLGWGGYSAFWLKAIRWTFRQASDAQFQTQVTEEHGRAVVHVEAVTKEGEFRNLLDLRAHVAFVASGGYDPETTEEVLTLEQTSPGQYETTFETQKVGAYVVTVEEREKELTKNLQTTTLVIPYSPEFQQMLPNGPLMEQVAERAQGEVRPAAADLFGRLRFGSNTLQDLWPLLLALAAILFLLDVALRRILLPWGEMFTLVVQFLRGRLPAWATAAPTPPPARSQTVGPLLNVKTRTRPGVVPTLAGAQPDWQGPDASAAATTVAAPDPEPEPQAPAAPPPPNTTTGKLLAKKRELRK